LPNLPSSPRADIDEGLLPDFQRCRDAPSRPGGLRCICGGHRRFRCVDCTGSHTAAEDSSSAGFHSGAADRCNCCDRNPSGSRRMGGDELADLR
jgi:hypothetical protein